MLVNLYTDWLWFGSLGFASVFSTMIFERIILALGVAAVVFLIVWINLLMAQRTIAQVPDLDEPEVIHVDFSTGTRKGFNKINVPWSSARNRMISRLIIGGSLIYGLLAGNGASEQWLMWLSFFNQVPYGMNDPLFGRDISFYLFTLPVLQEVYNIVFPVLILLLLFIAFAYVSSRVLHTKNTQTRGIRHLATLGCVIFITQGTEFFLNIWQMVYSSRGMLPIGAGYADVHALLPTYYLCIGLSVLAALVMIYVWYRPDIRYLVATPIVFFVVTVVCTAVYPNLIQAIQVTPNEFFLEREYLEHNIHYTRRAYNLDTMSEREFSFGKDADWAQLEEYSDSIENIRLLSYRQTQIVFSQLQGMRYYYRFADIDVDRYTIAGRLTQIMVGPRELTADALQTEADTWVNRHLKYTHGYGAVATPVKDYTAEGQPILWVKDIPPVSSVPELAITQPRIYFGELTHDYAVVGTRSKEFDYPQGDSNIENVYDGPDGIPITSIMDRLLFGIRMGSMNFVLTNELTPDSRILYYRQIMSRVYQIAPFLLFDPDPYMVIADGRLVWIIDAFTTSTNFPYSTPWSMEGHNYIRNSVKITIDAYDGQPVFYLLDPDDPVAATYANIFPDLFTPFSEMPEYLVEHLRYPEWMFTVQAHMSLLYHMTEPGVFYNQEDKWAFATQVISGGNPTPIEPYYALMRFPDFAKEEFMIMLPLTPISRDNMVAYLAGRSDGSHLGELFVYKFPKDSLVYGTAQVQARINQDASISQDLALWRQSGASIEWGNMITVPLKESLLYVNPLYIRSAATSLPELKRIVLAYGNTLVMAETLQEGLQRIFGVPPRGEVVQPGNLEPIHPSTGDAGQEVSEDLFALLERVIWQYAQVQDAFSSGDWMAYGAAMNELDRLVKALESEMPGE